MRKSTAEEIRYTVTAVHLAEKSYRMKGDEMRTWKFGRKKN